MAVNKIIPINARHLIILILKKSTSYNKSLLLFISFEAIAVVDVCERSIIGRTTARQRTERTLRF
jgi:hypothetical protein